MEDDIFIGNVFASRELRRWLTKTAEQKGKLSYNSVCIVIGPVGCGKTYGVMKACEQLGRVVHMIDSQNTENFKDTKDKIVKCVSANITDQFRFTEKVSNVIVIDEMETLISLDRSYLHSLQKMLDSEMYSHIPIIFTVQNSERKKVVELFNKACIIDVHAPSDADIFLLMRKSYPDMSVQILDDICTQSMGNLSVVRKMIDVTERNANAKQTDMHLDKISSLADVYKKPNPEIARYVFSEDPWLHPLRFHENLANEMSERKGLASKKQEVYLSLMHGVCVWDTMMCHFKGSDLNIPVEYVSRLVSILNHLPRKKSGKAPCDDFTKMFSHMSLEKKNQMAIYDNKLNNMGSYYKSVLDQISRKNAKKSFLLNV